MDTKTRASARPLHPAALPGDQLLLLACAAVGPGADHVDGRLAWLTTAASHGARALPRRLPLPLPPVAPVVLAGAVDADAVDTEGALQRFVTATRELLAAADEAGRRRAEDVVLDAALALAPTGLFDVMRCTDDALAAMVADCVADAA